MKRCLSAFAVSLVFASITACSDFEASKADDAITQKPNDPPAAGNKPAETAAAMPAAPVDLGIMGELRDHFEKPNGTLASSDVHVVEESLGGIFTLAKYDVDIIPACDARAPGVRKGTCPCPGGGTYDFDVVGAAGDDVTMNLTYATCVVQTGITMNGQVIHRQSGDKSLLFQTYDVDIARDGGQATKIDAVFRKESEEVDYAVELPSGWVRVAIEGNLDTFITDKSGTWSCPGDAEANTCTNGDRTLTY